MALRMRTMLSIAGLAALAACAESAPTGSDPTSTTPAFNNAADQAGDHPQRHIFELRNSPGVQSAAGSGEAERGFRITVGRC